MSCCSCRPAVTNVTNAVPYGTQILISTIGAAIVIIIARFLGGGR